ncbi:glycosyltransferase family 87 protein [Burkholderia sp. PU8-34]
MHLHRHSSAVLHVDADPELPAAGPRRRPHWLTERRMRAYSHTVLLCYFAFVGAYVVRLFGPHSTDLPRLTLDFTPIWSAAWLAAHGHALDAWQYAAVGAVELRAIPAMQAMPGGLPWLYPPTMLLWVLPLGWLPYMLAAALWLGGAYALFVAVCGAIVPRRTAMLCAFAFPGAFFATLIGQNSLLTAGLAGLGLLMLQRRPAAAGICFGLLTVKPQLAVLFPLALLCAGQWRALAAWAATVAGGAALATLAFGPAAWLSFLHGISGTYQAVGNSQAILARLPTLHAMSMLAGWPAIATKGLEAVSALVAAAAVCYAWRGTCTYALRAATLACASLLASPYLFDYDLAWYGIVIAWYARHAFSHGWRRFDREWLVLLWLMPPAGAKLVDHLHVQFMPFVTLASLALLVARISRERHEAPCLPDAHDSATDTDFAHALRPHDAAPRLHRLDRQHLPRGSRH